MRFSKAIFFQSTAPQSATKRNEHGVRLICLLFAQPKRLLRDVELLNHLPGNLAGIDCSQGKATGSAGSHEAKMTSAR